jgi:hypothetical protein
VAWDVEYTDEFGDWWATLAIADQDAITAIVGLLMQHGPKLPFPFSSGIAGSRHRHLRELRVQSRGKPVRIFYAFDPRRAAILLIGGVKASARFYKEMVPIAERLYDEHLDELKREGHLR